MLALLKWSHHADEEAEEHANADDSPTHLSTCDSKRDEDGHKLTNRVGHKHNHAEIEVPVPMGDKYGWPPNP